MAAKAKQGAKTEARQESGAGDPNKPFWVVAIPYNGAMGVGDVVGYFNHRRIKVGDRFKVTPKQFSKKWMERIEDRKAKQAEEEAKDLAADSERDEDDADAQSVI